MSMKLQNKDYKGVEKRRWYDDVKLSWHNLPASSMMGTTRGKGGCEASRVG